MPFFPCLCDLWHNDLLEELDPVVSCGSIMRLISYFLSLSVEGGFIMRFKKGSSPFRSFDPGSVQLLSVWS